MNTEDPFYDDEMIFFNMLVDPLPVGLREEVPLHELVDRSRTEPESKICIKICPVCGKNFLREQSNKIYCSSPCQKKAYKLRKAGKLQSLYSPCHEKKADTKRKGYHLTFRRIRELIARAEHGLCTAT